ncbi:MAG: hypothetical protein WC569_06930, partial [Candidatus Omnitrophota bacterium]
AGIAAVGLFYLLTIREGHDWGGDFSAYIHHAKNIAEGNRYEDIGYVYNPSYVVGPRAYPPILPLFLAPVYKWFGLNLPLMKTEIIFMFVLLLFVLFLTARIEMPFKYLLPFILLVGLNPYLWDFKDKILSEIPFTLLAYLALLAMHRVGDKRYSARTGFLLSAAAGFLIYLAYGTRTIGAIMLFLVIFNTVVFKNPKRYLLTSCLFFLFFAALQGVLVKGNDSYFFKDYFIEFFATFKFREFLSNIYVYIRGFSVFFDSGNKVFRLSLFLILSAFFMAGYLSRLRRGKLSVFELFIPVYSIFAIAWPVVGAPRYFIPVFPLYAFYAFIGMKMLLDKDSFRHKLIYICVLAAVFMSYAVSYAGADYVSIKEGIGKKEAGELFEYIRAHTDEDDVFIFQKPRVLALFTGRKASAYHCPASDKEFRDYINKIEADYIIYTRSFEGQLVRDHDGLYARSFAGRHKSGIKEAYRNPDFIVYKIALPLN